MELQEISDAMTSMWRRCNGFFKCRDALDCNRLYAYDYGCENKTESVYDDFDINSLRPSDAYMRQ